MTRPTYIIGGLAGVAPTAACRERSDMQAICKSTILSMHMQIRDNADSVRGRYQTKKKRRTAVFLIEALKNAITEAI